MKRPQRRRVGRRLTALAAGLGLLGAAGFANPAFAGPYRSPSSDTLTPIQHVVVIFQENVSFDHYFATYPYAANTDGTTFEPTTNHQGTPTVNGLGTLVEGEPSGVLLTANPNTYSGSRANPFRLSHSQASTCDQDHNYGAEQLAFDFGLMDNFPATVGSGSCGGFDYGHSNAIVMGYFDGNTVTALWNYAQRYAMSDNSFGTTFGPSTPGALNLIAGTTYGAKIITGSSPKVVATNGSGIGTLVGDLDPAGDPCSGGTTISMSGANIGDLLNAKGISWGWFEGGFNLQTTNPNGTTGCNRSSPATPANGGPMQDYIPHHEPFQYFASTQNLNHTRPNVPPSLYGTSADTGANHQYDTDDFFAALKAGNMPAVTFIKAPGWGDGHAGYSDPLLEQTFLVNTINTIENSKFWKSTAIIINYDDSDGWYDHQMNPIVNSSSLTNSNQAQYGDNLTGTGKCGNGAPLLTDDNGNPIQGRCGYGPRLVFMVISPYAKQNYVDHTMTDQSSIIRFVEDNWGLPRIGNGSYDAIAGPVINMFDFADSANAAPLILNPATGD